MYHPSLLIIACKRYLSSPQINFFAVRNHKRLRERNLPFYHNSPTVHNSLLKRGLIRHINRISRRRHHRPIHQQLVFQSLYLLSLVRHFLLFLRIKLLLRHLPLILFLLLFPLLIRIKRRLNLPLIHRIPAFFRLIFLRPNFRQGHHREILQRHCHAKPQH